MFNSEMPPTLPNKAEKTDKEIEQVPPYVAVEGRKDESLEDDRVAQQEQDSYELSRDMTQEDVTRLATRIVEQRNKEQEVGEEISFEAMRQEQLEMMDEVVPGNETATANDGKFSQDKMMSDKPGMSEWILSKLKDVPGGKKLFAALTLVIGLSAISTQAEARENDHFKDRIENRAARGAEGEIGRAISDLIRLPGKTVRDAARQAERDRNLQERQMMQEQRKAEQVFRSQERAAEQYVGKVAKEINTFNKSFDKVLLRKFKTDEDRDIAFLKEASDSMSSLERSDSEYIGKYGGNAHGLSTIAKEKLQNFSADVKSGKFSSVQWVENPLAGVTLERYNADAGGH